MSQTPFGSAGRVDVTDQQQLLQIPGEDVVSVARLALAMENAHGHVEVALVDDATISELHGRYLGDPTPTDVITFPLESLSYSCDEGMCACETGELEGMEVAAGEIVVSTETAIRQAPEFGTEPVSETLLYVIHGVLHLLGFDDIEDEDHAKMETRQEQILAAWKSGERAD